MPELGRDEKLPPPGSGGHGHEQRRGHGHEDSETPDGSNVLHNLHGHYQMLLKSIGDALGTIEHPKVKKLLEEHVPKLNDLAAHVRETHEKSYANIDPPVDELRLDDDDEEPREDLPGEQNMEPDQDYDDMELPEEMDDGDIPSGQHMHGHAGPALRRRSMGGNGAVVDSAEDLKAENDALEAELLKEENDRMERKLNRLIARAEIALEEADADYLREMYTQYDPISGRDVPRDPLAYDPNEELRRQDELRRKHRPDTNDFGGLLGFGGAESDLFPH